MFSHWLLGEVNLRFIAPIGPRRYPVWRTEQPAGAAVVDCRRQRAVGADRRHGRQLLVPDGAALACGLAAALAIAGMYFLRCLHPRRRGGPDGDPRRRRGTAKAITLC